MDEKEKKDKEDRIIIEENLKPNIERSKQIPSNWHEVMV